jgi:zinc protease
MNKMKKIFQLGLYVSLAGSTLGCFAGPIIESWTTEKGTKVLFVAAPEIAMLDVRVTFDAGSARDGANKGLASIANQLLVEGAGPYDADMFSDLVGRTGAILEHGTRRDMAFVGIRSLTEPDKLRSSLELLRLAMTSPRFDENAVARVKGQALVRMRLGSQTPSTIVEQEFYRQLYKEHPYGSPPSGKLETVQRIEREALVSFHRSYYVAGNALITLVGDIDRSDAELLAHEISSDLIEGEAPNPLPSAEESMFGIFSQGFPSIQSHVQMGLVGIKRKAEDYFPLLVGNHVLGGNPLVSILFDEVRSKRGLSYSVYSYFLPLSENGPFVISLQTSAHQTDEAISTVKTVLEKFLSDGPSEEQLSSAKNNLIGGFPLRLDSNRELIGYASMIGFYDLPLDYLDQFPKKIANVTMREVIDAFRRRIKLQNLVTVTVGPNL